MPNHAIIKQNPMAGFANQTVPKALIGFFVTASLLISIMLLWFFTFALIGWLTTGMSFGSAVTYVDQPLKAFCAGNAGCSKNIAINWLVSLIAVLPFFALGIVSAACAIWTLRKFSIEGNMSLLIGSIVATIALIFVLSFDGFDESDYFGLLQDVAIVFGAFIYCRGAELRRQREAL